MINLKQGDNKMRKAKKTISIFLIVSFLLACKPPLSFSQCEYCNTALIEDITENDSVARVLNSPLAKKMIQYIESNGGELDLNKGKVFIFGDHTIAMIPCGIIEDKNYTLAYIDLESKDEYLFLVESSPNINIFNSPLKIFSSSGKKITFDNQTFSVSSSELAFQEYDDLSNSKKLIYPSQGSNYCIIAIVVYVVYIFLSLIDATDSDMMFLVFIFYAMCIIPTLICLFSGISFNCYMNIRII